MDQKSWPWRKRSLEKTIVASYTSDFSSKESGEEMLPTEKEVSLEKSLENLNEKLASVLHESEAKSELLEIHAKLVEEAVAGREKAETEAVSLRQELDKALQQKIVSNERLTQLNTALKESMLQLSSVREDLEQRMRDAVMKTSREFEKSQKKLEEKLTEKSKKLANLTLENAHLNKALVANEKFIEDLSKRKTEAEAGFNTLMARLDSVDKENAFLKYEFRMLEKELDIRNEEIEFNRQSADVSHRQHMESAKKVTKLEAECQRLRVLVRKRLPGPAALAKMKNEAEILGRNQSDLRRKKLNSVTGSLVVKHTTLENPPDISGKKIKFLIDRLCDLEGENKTLKKIIAKKDEEHRLSLTLCAQTTSDFSKIEAQLEELAKGQKSFEIGDDIDRSESWASALSPEKHANWKLDIPNENRNFGVSDMSLMDDFVEMEKLAVVAVDDDNHIDARGKELVPVEQGQSKDYWLENVLKLILDQNHISKRSFDGLLEDIRIALSYMKDSSVREANKEESLKDSGGSDSISHGGYLTWKSPNISPRIIGDRTNFEEAENNLPEENMGLIDGLNTTDFSKQDFKRELMNQLRESEKTVGYLQKEIETLKESKGMVEDQMENQKLINEDLDTQLTVSKVKLNEVLQKLSSLEVELEDRSNCYEDLEATCLELQLQLESVNKEKEAPKDSIAQEERLLQTGWEITAASAKLAECQETIFNLGKQLKALASPNETSIFRKDLAICMDNKDNKKLSQRSSLRDQMLAADDAEAEYPSTPKTKEIILENEAPVENKSSMAMVPGKKRGGGIGFWRKLLLKRKRGSSKKTPRLFAA